MDHLKTSNNNEREKRDRMMILIIDGVFSIGRSGEQDPPEKDRTHARKQGIAKNERQRTNKRNEKHTKTDEGATNNLHKRNLASEPPPTSRRQTERDRAALSHSNTKLNTKQKKSK